MVAFNTHRELASVAVAVEEQKKSETAPELSEHCLPQFCSSSNRPQSFLPSQTLPDEPAVWQPVGSFGHSNWFRVQLLP